MALTIGKVAQMAGVNVETIRYYQRIGLINEPTKPLGGFRQYPIQTVQRICFIKRAQRLGFSLKEVSELLLLGGDQCEAVRKLAEYKRERIEARIQDLVAMRSVLDELIECCSSDRSTEHCSLIDALSSKPKDTS